MSAMLALTALLVRDYDEAIAFFVERLGFTLRADDRLDAGKCWVVVASGCSCTPTISIAIMRG